MKNHRIVVINDTGSKYGPTRYVGDLAPETEESLAQLEELQTILQDFGEITHLFITQTTRDYRSDLGIYVEVKGRIFFNPAHVTAVSIEELDIPEVGEVIDAEAVEPEESDFRDTAREGRRKGRR